VLTETLFVFAVAVSLFATVRALRDGSVRWAVAAGLAASVASLIRPPYLAVALVLTAWWWFARAGGGRGPRRAAVAFGLALLSLVAVWTGRNLVELGALVPTSTESGFVFYQGNSRGATGGSGGYVWTPDFDPIEVPTDRSGEVERDRFYLERALADMAADPVAVVARWPAKLWNMWRPTYEGASPRNKVVTLATYLPVLALGVLGAATLARGGWRASGAALAILLVTWVAVHVLVTGMIRFRLAAELMLLETVPFGCFALIELLRRRR
jgi:hypothetical protein